MKGYWYIIIFLLPVLLAISFEANCQLVFTGQLRTRTELRDGQGTLTPKNSDPAFFTSQRTRLSMRYTSNGLRLQSSLQDVRVWGQDASTINRTTTESRNGMLLHEAWAEVLLRDTTGSRNSMTLKVGRQELLYDDSRLLGNLDWLQQARRHDAALLKFASKKWTSDLGVAFNQNAERLSGSIYNGIPTPGTYSAGTNGIGTMYKSLQFLYANRKLKHGYLSFLILKDDFNKFHLDTTAVMLDKGVWSRVTAGVNGTENITPNLSFYASAFRQFGKNKTGKDLSAWFMSLYLNYKLSEKSTIGAGADWLSGTKAGSTSDKQFDPLYGTPHKFWGYMDYFYASSPSGTLGLKDYYLKWRFIPASKLVCTFDLHEFFTATDNYSETGAVAKRLGTELDIVCTYPLTKEVGIETGYCTMLATAAMSSTQVKNVNNADNHAHWGYAMIIIKTDAFRVSK